MDIKTYTMQYLKETIQIANQVSVENIVLAAGIIKELKSNGGRLFILGVGGSAANAAHAVNDFRKLAEIETYAPTDNVAELTARTNDEGWETTFVEFLRISKLGTNDVVLIFSVGGGSDTTSRNIKEAVDFAIKHEAKIVTIVSRDGGYAGQKSNATVLIPVVANERITPHAEGWQGIVWHLIVNVIREGA